MKIAFVSTTFENTVNGPAKFARLLYKDSLKNNRKIIFFTEDTSLENETLIKINVPNYFNIPGIGFIYRLIKYFLVVNGRKEIQNVVCNNTIYCFLFYFFSNKKIIGFINDDDHIDVRIKLSYNSVRSYIFSSFEKFCIKKNNITIVNSVFLKKKIESKYNGNTDSIRVLYKGIEIHEKLNLFKHDEDSVFKIVFVKSNFKRGGLETLVDSLQNMVNVHLTIVTTDLIKNDPVYKKILNLNSHEIFYNLTQKEVFKLMSEAHSVCIPAKKEALGVANMEGMHYSCCIISTNVGGIPEVLDYGNSGLMIDPENIQLLRKKIIFLKDNRKCRKQFVKKGYKFVHNFSIENSIKNFYIIAND